jgi:uncharacterized RDD family membrane protein YckC
MSETLPPVKNIYGNFWYRFLAVIIDAIVLGLMSSVIMVPLFMYLIKDGFDMNSEKMLQNQLISSAISYLLYIVYGTVMEGSKWQGGIGKKVLNLKVTNLEGEPLNFSEALQRNLFKYWATLITVVFPFVSDIKPFVAEPGMEPSEMISLMFASGYMLLGLSLGGLSLIGYVIAAFTERRQAIHDMLAKTVVLNTKVKSASTDDEW